MVSLESPSGVEYGIKKIFSFFDFYKELTRFKFCEDSTYFSCFIHNFAKIC